MKGVVKGDVLSYRLLHGKLFVKSPMLGWMRIEDYCTYICAFPTVYPTHKEAKKRGYEAHHVTPKSCQKEVLGAVEDDSCVRVTPFEHFIAHWFLSKECEEGAKSLSYLGLGKLILCTEEERRFLYQLCGDHWKNSYDDYLMTFGLTGRKYLETLTDEEFASYIRNLVKMDDLDLLRWLGNQYQR